MKPNFESLNRAVYGALKQRKLDLIREADAHLMGAVAVLAPDPRDTPDDCQASAS